MALKAQRDPEDLRGGGSSSGDTSSFVSQTFFNNQVDRILDSIENGVGGLSSSLADQVSTAVLTVSGNASIGGALSITGDLTKIKGLTYAWPSAHTASGVLQNDGAGTLTWATLGAAAVTPDSLNFTEFLDALSLDASTDIAVDNAEVFSITNTGTGNSFLVNDSAGDATPFTIDASGNVSIGGTLTLPTPFTLGATSVTTTGAQLNYLNAVTGTTGTTSTNLVFSTSPTLITPALGTPTALVLTNATGLPAASVLAGTFGAGAYTIDTSLTVPTIVGGTGTTSDLNLKTTSGVGATGADMHFLVGNNGATEAMTILNSGNVGIGTTAPGSVLDVRNSISVGTNGSTIGTVVLQGGANMPTLTISGWAAGANAKITTNSNSDRYVQLSNDTAGKFLGLLVSGNVGIGTTAPAGLLHISSDTAATGLSYFTQADGSADGFDAIFRKARGTGAVPTVITTADELGVLNFTGYGGASGYVTGAAIKAISSGTIADTRVPGFLSFWTGTDATPSVLTERMRILNNGNVGIGTTGPGTKLEIGSSDLGDGVAGPVITLGRNTNATNTGAGSINYLSKAGTAGYVWQDAAGKLRIHTAAPTNVLDTAGVVVGDQTSTRETKQDINDYTDYDNALALVLGTPLHTFRYIKEVQGYGTNSPLAKLRIGYIADEVNPQFMVGNAIDQVSVNGLLMASIKALDIKIKDLSIENGPDAGNWVNNLGQYAGEFFGSALQKVENGLAYIKGIVVDILTVDEGINMKDQATGDYYCVVIKNGEFDKQLGKCGTQETETISELESTPEPIEEPVLETELTPEEEIQESETPVPEVKDLPEVPAPETSPTPEENSTSDPSAE